MALLACPVCSLLLLALLLAVAPCPAWAKMPPGHPCSSPRRGMLNCRHAGLATMPPATGVRNLVSLDFTDNSISTLGPESWKEYQWTETLILKNNDLQAVKSHSLEGLLLLKKLDLSGNNIKSIEERAFEPLPFLQHLNLSGNQLSQIPSGAFHTWHGLQFLQELILSHNPLTVIADTEFFKLPSVNLLDLSATQVSAQTLLMFLQTAFQLETLKVPSEVSCCLCKERGPIETPCRTIQFVCENLCSTSTAQCSAPTGSLAHAQGGIVEAAKSGQLKSSSVLYLKPKKTLLRDDGSVTFAVSQKQTGTKGDLSSQEDSTAPSYSSQHLSSQESKAIDELMVTLRDFQKTGWTGETERRKTHFRAEQQAHELKNKKSDAQSTLAVENTVPHQPAPARHKAKKFPAVEEKKTTGWKRKQLNTGLNRPVLSRWDVAGGLKPTDSKAAHRHHSAQEAAARRKSPIQMYERRPRDTRYQARRNSRFYEAIGSVRPEEEATLRVRQSQNRKQETLLELWAKSRLPVSTIREDTAGEERPSPEGSWKRQEERSWLPNKAGGSYSAGPVLVPAQLLLARVDHQLHSQEPQGAVQTFITRVRGALSTECSLPELRLLCARLVSKAGLLLKRLTEPQDSQGAAAFADRCLRQGNLLDGPAWKKPTEKHILLHSYSAVASLLLFIITMISSILFILIGMVIYLIHARCRQYPADAFEPQSTEKSCLGRFFGKLRWGGMGNVSSCARDEEDEMLTDVRSVSEHCLSPCETHLPCHGASTNDTRKSSQFQKKMLVFMLKQQGHGWGRGEDMPEAEAAENNPRKQEDRGNVTT